MADAPTPLLDEWEKFRIAAVHPATGAWQLGEMRRVFLAGALAGMLVAADEQLAAFAEQELDAFEAEIEAMARLADTPTAGRA